MISFSEIKEFAYLLHFVKPRYIERLVFAKYVCDISKRTEVYVLLFDLNIFRNWPDVEYGEYQIVCEAKQYPQFAQFV